MSNAHRLSLYWVVAMAAGYVATVLYYRWRDRTSGVVASVWPFVLTGAALFVLLILVSPGGLAPSLWFPDSLDGGSSRYCSLRKPSLLIL